MDDETRFWWEWILHEDKLFTDRAYFFIVAEAMMLVGAAAVLADGLVASEVTAYRIICGAGIVVTAIWFYVCVVHLHTTINRIKIELRKNLPEYRDFVVHRRKWGSTHALIGVYLPAALLVIWLLLLTLVHSKV